MATILAASDAGVDAVDCAMDALSGNTVQATLGHSGRSLQHTDRDTGLDIGARPRDFGLLGSRCARNTRPLRRHAGPVLEVYLHEMPGGQFTNLKAQARSLGTRRTLARGRADLFGRERDVR